MHNGWANDANDFDLALQHSIASRLDGNQGRAQDEDDARGFGQSFNLGYNFPILYNDPPTPQLSPPYAPQQNPNPDWDFGSVDLSIDSSSSNPCNFPWTPDSPPFSPMSVTGSESLDRFINGLHMPHNESLLPSGHSPAELVPQAINPWNVLSCSVLKNYKAGRDIKSEGAVDNASINMEDKWKRVPGMNRFKGKKKLYEDVCGVKKRKAITDPDCLMEGCDNNFDEADIVSNPTGERKRRQIKSDFKPFFGHTCYEVGESSQRGQANVHGIKLDDDGLIAVTTTPLASHENGNDNAMEVQSGTSNQMEMDTDYMMDEGMAVAGFGHKHSKPHLTSDRPFMEL